jgi:toxin ParE1/3/4
MAYRVVLRPLAVADLKSIFDWVAGEAGFDVALAFDQRLREACRALADFPRRGTPHPDLMEGLRSVVFERRTSLYYVVEERTVRIIRIVRAGQDPVRAFDRG